MAQATTVKLNIDGKGAAASLADLQKDASRLRNILRNLDPNSPKVAQYKKRLDEVNATINDTKSELGLVRKRTEKATESAGTFGKAWSKAGDIMKGALAATGILALVDNVLALVQGFGELSRQTIETRSQLARLTGLTGEELDDLTSKVMAFATRTGREPVEAMRALNVSAKAFGVSADEAFNRLNQLTTLAVDAQGDLLDVVAEYSPQLAEAGVSQEAFFATLINAERNGVFSLDKVGDFYKEFSLRIREQTPATADALAALGTGFRDELFANLNAGTTTVDEALQQVVTRIEETGVRGAELQTIIADTFGGPGEDLGTEFLLTLNDTSQSFQELVAGADDYTRAQFRLQEIQEKFFRTITKVTNVAKEFGAELISRADPILNLFSGLGKEMGELFDLFRGLLRSFGILSEQGTTAQFVIDALAGAFTILAAPIRFVITVLGGLVKGFAMLYNSSELVRGTLGGLASAAISAFESLRDGAVNILGGVGDILAGIFTLDTDLIKRGLEQAARGVDENVNQLGVNAGKAFAEGFAGAQDNRIDLSVPEIPAPPQQAEATAPAAGALPASATSPAEAPSGTTETTAAAPSPAGPTSREQQVAARQQVAEAELGVLQAQRTDDPAQILEAQKTLLEAQRQQELASVELTATERQLITEQYRQKERELQTAFDEERLQKQTETAQREIELLNEKELAKAEIDLLRAEREGTPEEQLAAQIALLEAQREAELRQLEITEEEKELVREQYRNQILAAEEEFNQKRLEKEKAFQASKRQIEQEAVAAGRELLGVTVELLQQEAGERSKFGATLKALKIADVKIALVTEIQKIWEYANSNPTNALFPGAAQIIAGVKTAAAVGRAALATANIAKQKFAGGGGVPSVTQTGTSKTGGPITGPSHADGGVPFTVSGQPGFEAEGGEYITNKRATARNYQALDTINRLGHRYRFEVQVADTRTLLRQSRTDLRESSRTSYQAFAKGGLVPVVRFATGGLLASTPSVSAIQGGAAAAEQAGQQESGTAGAGIDMEVFFRLVGEVQALRQDIAAFERERRVFLNYTDLEDTAAKVAQIRAE